jgi:hypothetical protein
VLSISLTENSWVWYICNAFSRFFALTGFRPPFYHLGPGSSKPFLGTFHNQVPLKLKKLLDDGEHQFAMGSGNEINYFACFLI